MDFSILNFCENLVVNEVRALSQATEHADKRRDFWEDVACVALNQLPPRYVRFLVDTSFYMSSEERSSLEAAVKSAVEKAVETVARNPRRP